MSTLIITNATTNHAVIKEAVSLLKSLEYWRAYSIEAMLGAKFYTLCDCARTGKYCGAKQRATAIEVIACINGE